MTTLVAWVGVDSHKPASAYIESDSRISWSYGPGRAETWDQGMKTFASSRYPDIAGYWGDVLFPLVTLSQFFANLDAGVIVLPNSSSSSRFQALEKMLRVARGQMPLSQQRPFAIVYAARDGDLMKGIFRVRILSCSDTGVWNRRELPTPESSAVVYFGGSGAAVANAHLQRWQASPAGGTSRAVHSAFVDGLMSGADPLSGGAPQLVGIYRIGAGRTFGTVVRGERFLNGAPVTDRTSGEAVEWRNELFERVSGDNKRRLPDAQRHSRP